MVSSLLQNFVADVSPRQVIVYAKGSSHVLAKLRGTYMASATANAPAGISTDLQKSIFGAPPSAVTAVPAAAVGTKRPREEESDEGEAPMDEDESDVSMEASSDED